jgi:hypothetical protein
MSVGLTAPLFLIGLLGLAVPVLVHLVRREERASVVFPSLMFLQRMPEPERRQRTLRDRALLLLRCLALAGLCLAFARPYLELPGSIVAAGAGRLDVVLVLDRSYSLAWPGRFAAARAAARRALDELGPGDRAALVLLDHRAEVRVGLTTALGTVRDALQTSAPGPGHTDLLAGVERAGRLLAESDAGRREVVLISDFQRTGVSAERPGTLPAGVVLRPAAIAGGAGANAAVANVNLVQGAVGLGEPAQLKARIVNTGEEPLSDLPVRLEVDGRPVDSRALDLSPGEVGEVEFSLVVPPRGTALARIHLPADALPADNARHVVLAGTRAVRVGLLRDAGADARQRPHLARALAQGSDPTFLVHTLPADGPGPRDLASTDVVVVDDAPVPGGAAGERLAEFVRAGGGLLVVAAGGTRGAWPGGPGGILPGTLGPEMAREAPLPGRLLDLDVAHPALAAFAAPGAGDLAGARVHRYRGLSGVPATAILARYDDGSVGIAERRVGRGRVLVVTTTLDPRWSTLALWPGYVPLVHGIVTHLASHTDIANAFELGDAVDLARYARTLPGFAVAAAALRDGAAAVARPPGGGARETVREGGLRIARPGFYEVHVSGGGAAPLVLAANTRATESDLTPMDPDTFAARLATAAAGAVARAAPGPGRDAPQRREPWWYLVLACTVLLAGETWMSNRLSMRRSQRA